MGDVSQDVQQERRRLQKARGRNQRSGKKWSKEESMKGRWEYRGRSRGSPVKKRKWSPMLDVAERPQTAANPLDLATTAMTPLSSVGEGASSCVHPEE
ncbi:hypothetical protein H920_12922 [Fukomys damarensis]|uniref:Uncharacterized protein n=1 Tax=Fukomys damarensis TaxID=885580 RepID=A0A091DSM9_FUKDA|nr:hypothetical protein H920_12922 [Fukomys damarensis]